MDRTLFIKLMVYYFATHSYVWCDRVHDKIYYDVNATQQCFRRLNSTHQIGCASKQGGNVGILHYIPSEVELDWLIEKGPHAPYIVLLTQHTFRTEVMTRLRESNKINGILVITNMTDLPYSFSPDATCPNVNFELYANDSKYSNCSSQTWNPDGTNFLHTDMEFPIISLGNMTQVEYLINECYEKFNSPLSGGTPRSYPLCGAQIQAGMDAVKDTPTCINRGKTRNLNPQMFCDPLGDNNVHAFLHPIHYNKTLNNESVIIAAAKLDATGLFTYLVPGAHTTAASFITLLAAAQALGKVKNSIDPETDKPIMFSFYQGESFDYMGSLRQVYDMERGLFPNSDDPEETGGEGLHTIYPHHIGSFLEVSQVAATYGGKLYAHSDPISGRIESVKTGVTEIENLLSTYGEEMNLNINPTSDDSPLPPASLQSFLKKINIPGVVLADHKEEYTNQFYNSHQDIPLMLGYNQMSNESQTEVTPLAEHLTNVATTVARTLYHMSTGRQYNEETPLMADNTTIAQMLYCFYVTPQCDFFNFTLNEESAANLGSDPYSLYVGIQRITNPVSIHANYMLAYFTGDIKDIPEENCTTEITKSPYYDYIWMQGPVNTSSPDQRRTGICVETTAKTLSGVSPAFLEGNDLTSTEYPAWTESIWTEHVPQVRVFLIPDKKYEIMTLCIGIAVLVICLPGVILVNKRASLLFSMD